MAADGIDAFLVRGTSSIYWLTAFDGVFDDEPAHALLVTQGAAVLHTDSRYADACERAQRATGAPLTVDAERTGHAAFAAKLLASVQAGGAPAAKAPAAPPVPASTFVSADAAPVTSAAAARPPSACVLGIEDATPLSEFRALEAELAKLPARPTVRETHGFVEALRTVKDEVEIARLAAAQAITDAAFGHIVGFMRPGMTEREVQVELEDFMRRHGAEGLAFPSIVATGANGASPHAIPGQARLQAGQCVVMDFGARAQGYCSDMTRTVFLGQPSKQMARAYETLRRANEQVEAMLKPGVTGAEAHELAEQILAEGGFAGAMGHSLGHGVGIDVHEEPLLSPRNERPLQPGNVVTVEPGIYLPGEFGMRLEDFGVVTQDGFHILTQSPHEMVIIDRLT